MGSRPLRKVCIAVMVGIGLVPAAWADDLSSDLSARRAKVMERLGPDAMAILLSAPTKTYSLDVDYEFRQDSNLYYLTGIDQPDTVLVIMPGNADHRELLFVRDADPVLDHWDGPVLSHEEATAQSGVARVISTSRFEPFLAALLGGRPTTPLDRGDAVHFVQALADGTARIGLAMEPRDIDGPLTPALELAARLRDRFFGFQFLDITPVLTDLRVVKTPYERQLLVSSLEIANEAQKAGMRAAKPGAYEYEVRAAVESAFTARGGSWSFPPILGSGPKTTILHNRTADRQLQAGDLMLVDAAASYEYMAGDLTRTYPVSGVFTEEQRDIYQLVLQSQAAAMDVARPGNTLRQVHDRATEVLAEGLLELGLITDATGSQYHMWFTHGATHYLGIDVHDVGSLDRELEPGMAFVIEPGLYIRQAALAGLRRTPENDGLIEHVRPAVTKYADIGVRIEDAFLLEETGLRHLTSGAPRTVEEIEAFFRR